MKFPQLKEVTEAAKQGAVPLFVMYPGPTSEPIEDVVERLNNGGLGQGADGADGGDGGHQGQQQQQQPFSKYNLLVIDGTWQEAREMFTTIREHVLPPQVPSYRVEISIDEGESFLLLLLLLLLPLLLLLLFFPFVSLLFSADIPVLFQSFL